MSHYYSLVVIPGEGDVDQLIDEAMAPHQEDDNCMGLWDWYQIGGRWTGRLSGYDPTKDPANNEVCILCGGTGHRTDDIAEGIRQTNPDFECNGCKGSGTALKWPTQFADFDGDVVPVSNAAEFTASLTDAQVPYAVIAHGSEGKAVVKDEWDGNDWVERHASLGIRTMLGTILVARERAGLTSRVAVVDYHS